VSCSWCEEIRISRFALASACNPSYSGGRDQDDHSSKPAQANSSMRPYLKKPFTKIRLMEWLKVKKKYNKK
jgi:hypothetical protein